MHFKIVQLDVEISEAQAEYLNETLRMQLGRYTQAIDLVTVTFCKDTDQFGQAVIHCAIDIDNLPEGKTQANNISTTLEMAAYNAASRAKRQLDRHRRASMRQSVPPYICK